MAPSTAAEKISESTWSRLGRSWHLHARLGEETLTDLLVLDFLPSASHCEVKIFQTTKPQEVRQGTDLVIFVRRGTKNADIYAVQAKKLSIVKRYDHLKQRAGQTQQWQIDVLERYAKNQRAVPLYLLFNHVDDSYLNSDYWHCCQQTMDKKQFGCTLVPSWRIREAISNYGCRTLGYIHSDRAALPWRCAFDCPKNQMAWGQIREKAKESYYEHFSGGDPSSEEANLRIEHHQMPFTDSSFSHAQYEGMDFSNGVGEWPSELWERGISSLSAEETTRLYETPPPASAAPNIPRFMFLPRWIMLVNNDDNS